VPHVHEVIRNPAPVDDRTIPEKLAGIIHTILDRAVPKLEDTVDEPAPVIN
jgi:hypothetical protein